MHTGWATYATADPLSRRHDFRQPARAWHWVTPTCGDNDYQYPGNIFRVNICTKRQGTDLNVEVAVPFMFALRTNAIGIMEQIYPKGKNGKFGYVELLDRF